MWIPLKVKAYAIVVAGVVSAVVYSYLRGRADAVVAKENERLQDYVDTRKTIDLAEDSIADAGGGREWLLQRKR